MATRRISLWILLVTVLAPCIEAGQNQPSASVDTTILSDTRGFDFGPYINQVVNRIRANWYMVQRKQGLGEKDASPWSLISSGMARLKIFA